MIFWKEYNNIINAKKAGYADAETVNNRINEIIKELQAMQDEEGEYIIADEIADFESLKM